MKMCRSCDCAPPYPNPCARLCIAVGICGNDTAGCTVHVKSGGVDIDGSPVVTPSNGRVCFEFPDGIDDITITVDRPDDYMWLEWPQASFDLGNIGQCEDHFLTMDFADPALWTCECGQPIPKMDSLSVSVSGTTIGTTPDTFTIVRPDPTGLGGTWGGCYTKTLTGVQDSACSGTADGDVPFAFSLACEDDTYTVTISHPFCIVAGVTEFRLGDDCADVTGGTQTPPYTLLNGVGVGPLTSVSPFSLVTNFAVPTNALFHALRSIYSPTLHITVGSMIDPFPSDATWTHTNNPLGSCVCPATCEPGTVCFPVEQCVCPDGTPIGGTPGADQAFWTLDNGSDLVVATLTGCEVCFEAPTIGTYTIDGPTSPCYESNGEQDVLVDRCDGELPYTQSLTPKKYTARIRVRGCDNVHGWYLQDAQVQLTGGAGSGYGTQTAMTDVDGWATFHDVPADCDYTAEARYPRFADVPSRVYHSQCHDWDADEPDVLVFSTAAPGYRCSYCAPYPIPTRLLLQDAWGAHTWLELGGTLFFADYSLCYESETELGATGVETAQCSALPACERDEHTGDLLLDHGSWSVLYNWYPDLDTPDPCGLHVVYSGCDETVPGPVRIAKGTCAGILGAAPSCSQVAGATPILTASHTPPFILTFGVADGPTSGTIVISE